MLAKIPLEGCIVQESYIGNTHIYISDGTYSKHTPEEWDRIAAEFNQKGLNIYLKHPCPMYQCHLKKDAVKHPRKKLPGHLKAYIFKHEHNFLLPLSHN